LSTVLSTWLTLSGLTLSGLTGLTRLSGLTGLTGLTRLALSGLPLWLTLAGLLSATLT